jgi:uncharacterized hydrophobic protein (TIGR00271 family)
VINAEANGVLANLRAWSVIERGSVVIEDVPAAFSGRLHRAERGGPKRLRFSPVWDQVDARIRSDGRYPPSWFLLLTIASVIAAVGIFTNSQILVVGAMVVGPEYSAIISVAYAIDRHERSRVRSGLLALLVGFAAAILATFAFSLLVRAAGWESTAFRLGFRPVSSLIDQPNAFSVVVATLAGIVGVVSLVEARTGAMIGVFISVTTVPAAADIGTSVAFHKWSEAWGSLVQLLLNVVILVAVGAVGLWFQRRFWRPGDVAAGAT